MKFNGTSMRSLARLLIFMNKYPKIRMAFNVENSISEVWTRLGFTELVKAGDSLIPSCVGKASHFNAHGKDVIRKDLPMIDKDYMSFRTWEDWHGQTHSGLQHRTVKAYPRDRIPAPSELMQVQVIAGEMHIISRELDMKVDSEDSVRHIANLMLECFGGFDAVDASMGAKIGTKYRRLQWEILPPGKYPWSRVKPLISGYTENLAKPDRDVIEYRMAEVSRFNPSFLAAGKGGFNSYFVYGFEDKGVYVLESAHLDNATYIFKENWETFSKLTKNDIINGDVPHKRIIHDRKWRPNLGRALSA